MSEYEFTTEQNEKFNQLSQKLKLYVMAFIALGIVTFLEGVARGMTDGWSAGVLSIILGIIWGFIGYLMMRPLKNLHNIITTTGNDIGEFMKAMKDLNVAFGFYRLLGGIILIAIFIRMITSIFN